MSRKTNVNYRAPCFFSKILTGYDFTEKNVLSSSCFMKVSNVWGYFGNGTSILFAGERMPESKFVLVSTIHPADTLGSV